MTVNRVEYMVSIYLRLVSHCQSTTVPFGSGQETLIARSLLFWTWLLQRWGAPAVWTSVEEWGHDGHSSVPAAVVAGQRADGDTAGWCFLGVASQRSPLWVLHDPSFRVGTKAESCSVENGFDWSEHIFQQPNTFLVLNKQGSDSKSCQDPRGNYFVVVCSLA